MSLDIAGKPAPGERAVPKISVCLPTFNRAQFLKETLASMLAQTVTDFEVIVADNCSTDSTNEIVETVQDGRLRYIRNESNIGHYRNMNRCLELARGEYVCIVHDDDVYASDFLQRESEILDRHLNVGMVHCAVYMVDPNRNPLRLHQVYPDTRIVDGLQEFIRYLGGHNVCCSTVMFRRALFERVGPFVPELMCADWLMWLNLALRGDVAYVATPLAEVRVHGTSMTSTMDPLRWYNEFIEVADRALATLQETHPALIGSCEQMLRVGARQQSKRFFIAALGAAMGGAGDQSRGYIDVLKKLEVRGASRWYALTARALVSPMGRRILQPVKKARLAIAKARLHRASWR